jgi:hypothetical protein
MKPMIDIKKLKEFQSAIEKINYEICEHAITDLKATCSDDCPYRRLCDLITRAKCRITIMEHRPNNPNFVMGE